LLNREISASQSSGSRFKVSDNLGTGLHRFVYRRPQYPEPPPPPPRNAENRSQNTMTKNAMASQHQAFRSDDKFRVFRWGGGAARRGPLHAAEGNVPSCGGNGKKKAQP